MGSEIIEVVMIPKPDGGERPLGIPTIRDRVVQTAAKLVLEPIFEADFEDNAYGYCFEPLAGGGSQQRDAAQSLPTRRCLGPSLGSVRRLPASRAPGQMARAEPARA
jgi:hypothetical protein